MGHQIHPNEGLNMELKKRFSFFQYKGHQVEMVTYPPYPWRIAIDGHIVASVAGKLTEAKRFAKKLIN